MNKKHLPQALGGARIIPREEVITLLDSKKLSEMTYSELKIIQFELKSVLFELLEAKSKHTGELLEILFDIEMMLTCDTA